MVIPRAPQRGLRPGRGDGWAFGMGYRPHRLLKYEIDDIRLLVDNVSASCSSSPACPGDKIASAAEGVRRDRARRARGGRPADHAGSRGAIAPWWRGSRAWSWARSGTSGTWRERGRAPHQLVRWRCPTAATRWSAARPTRRRACARLARPRGALPGLGEVRRQDPRVVSEGSCARERWHHDDHSGLLLLPAEAPLAPPSRGTWAWTMILDIEITPNRPDALSVVGWPARSPAHRRPRSLSPRSWSPRARRRPPRSPRWTSRRPTSAALLRARHHRAHREALAAVAGQRLRAVGCGPQQPGGRDQHIMWEMGQRFPPSTSTRWPSTRGVVRRARPGERITTLDGQERAVGPGTTPPGCVRARGRDGGVMGGADSE